MDLLVALHFSFNSDPNTGISGGSDTLTFSTGGTGRMSISSAGLVNIPVI